MKRHILFATDRLTVTRADTTDIDRLLPILANPATMALYGDGRPMRREDVETMLASYPQGDPNLLAQPGIACLTGTDTVVGFGGVGFYRAPGNTADVLVVLDQRYQGQGFGTELVRAAMRDAFDNAGIDVVHATVHPDNVASIRMLERAGMQYAGRQPGHNRLRYRIGRGDRP